MKFNFSISFILLYLMVYMSYAAPGDVTTIPSGAITAIIGPGGAIRATSPKTQIFFNGSTVTINSANKTVTFTGVSRDDPRLSDARPPTEHNQAATTISGLSTVATSGSYTDLNNQPTIPSTASQIAYNTGTVADTLNQLTYTPITINLYTMSGSSSNPVLEIGGSYSVQGSGLYWETNKTATTTTVNGVSQSSPYMPPGSPFSTNQSWLLYVNDGQTSATATRSITFTHKRYWGVSGNQQLFDDEIRALSSEFSTNRSQTRTFAPSGQYLYLAYLATAGAATITVNGFLDTSWVLVQRDFVNASGYTAEFRIYRSAYPLTGTYSVVVS